MRDHIRRERLAVIGLLVGLALLVSTPVVADEAAATAAGPTVAATAEPAAEPEPQAEAAAAEKPKPRLDIYGFAMLDMGYQFGHVHPFDEGLQ